MEGWIALLFFFGLGAFFGWSWAQSRWLFYMAKKYREFRLSNYDPEVWTRK